MDIIQISIILSIISCILTAILLPFTLYALILVKSLEKQTHTVQFMPVDEAVRESFEMTKLLVDSGADVNKGTSDFFPVLNAVNGFFDPNSDSNHDACRIIKYLKDAGADINKKERHGRTPLDEAKGYLVWEDYMDKANEIIKCLESMGAR